MVRRRKPSLKTNPRYPGITVHRSKIHGRGIFATKNFTKGSLVVRWDLTHELSAREVAKLPKRELDHVATYGPRKFILHVASEKYMNHSCDPNTKISRFGDVAIRRIHKGEELTTDYGNEGEPINLKRCHCGSLKCKGFLDY